MRIGAVCAALFVVMSIFSGISAAEEAAAQKAGEPIVLDRVVVTGDEAPEQGYRSRAATQLGPLGEIDLKDTPYSVQVIPRELIENAQAYTADDALRLSPVAQLTSPQSRFFTSVNLRGFSSGTSKRIDGLPNSNYVTVDLEDKERIEVLTGLSGFLYGIGNVGGTLNYVLKRPTAERLNRLTLANTGGENYRLHGDFGGPIDAAGRFGYRLNAVVQGGDTVFDEQSIERQFVSGALDWKVSDRLLLQFDASHSDYEMHGSEPYWTTSGVRYPDAPDAGEFYGQPFTYTDTQQDHAGAKLDWKLSEIFSLRSAYAYRSSGLKLLAANNTIVSDEGDYTVRAATFIYPDESNQSAYAFIDAAFDTGAVAHKLTFGYYGQKYEGSNFRFAFDADGEVWTNYSGFNLSDPHAVPAPVHGDYIPRYIEQRATYGNAVLGDHLRFGEHWSALVGVNYATIRDGSSGDSQDRLSPTLALLYRPSEGLTVYANYMESYEQGGTAGPTYNDYAVVNAGEVMQPLTSRQYEIGSKFDIGGLLLTGALFRINRGLEYYDLTTPTAPVYVQDGREVHDGFEFTATGKATERLTLVGGFTILDARVEKNEEAPEIEGNTPQNVAERYAKLYAEYALLQPAGLWLSAALYYTGPQKTDLGNADSLPAFTTADIGLRYQMPAFGKDLVLRFNVTNLTEEDYWLSSYYLGRPRSFVFSAQLSF